MSSYKVIDVSKFNIVSDYAAAAKQVDGVIIRAGYRAYRTGTLIEDPLFKTHIEGFVKNNAKVGIYFFTTAVSETEAREEADFAVSLIKKYKMSFPIFADSEMSNNNHNGRSDSLPKTKRTDYIIAFCERIRQLGYVPGIYASDSWFVSQLDYERIKNYKLWVASYSRSPYRVPKYVGWQFSSKQSITGIKGNVDESYWYEAIGDPKDTPADTQKNPYLKPSTTVKKGMRGEAVKWLQWELNQEGYSLKVDGIFGNGTLAAVKSYQKKQKLVVDGLVGPKTIAALVGASNTVTGNKILATSAIYSASATLEEDPKVPFEEGVEFIVTGVNMYRFWFSLIPYTVVHGKCKLLSTRILNDRIKSAKVSTIDGKYIGWFKLKDINNLFE